FSCGPCRSSAPHPPGPGLPLQAPSVHICTSRSVISLLVLYLICHRRHRAATHAPSFPLAPCRADQAHAGHPLDGGNRVDGTQGRPPAIARMLHETPAQQPSFGVAQGHITAEAATMGLEG